nr:carboxylic acid reductase [Blastochloris viridis]
MPRWALPRGSCSLSASWPFSGSRESCPNSRSTKRTAAQLGPSSASHIDPCRKDDAMRLARTVDQVMSRFADRPAIGERPRRPVRNDATSQTVLDDARSYDTITYRELWGRANAIAAEFQQNGDHALRPGERVAFLAFTSGDYAAIDLACIRLGAVTVPLQTTASGAELGAIVAETEPAILAVSPQYLDAAIKLALAGPSVRRVVVFDFHPQVDEHRDAFEAAMDILRRNAGCALTPLAEVLEQAAGLPGAAWPADDDANDPLAMLIYTSGSTGSPKGAMYTETLAGGMWGGSWSRIFSDERAKSIHYMPMSHVAGHSALKNTLARGGTCYFTSRSNLSSLLEDIALAKPTELSLVPRVCEMLYQRFHSEMAKRLSQGGEEAALEAAIMEEMRTDILGGDVKWASCSSAPLSRELKTFTERLLGVELHNVYGSTEAGGIWVDNKLLRPPITDYKLIDAPELGYHLTDRPFPRGELLLKTTSIIPGYYRRPDLAEELFDPEGFYRTGDIVAETGEGELHFVDRRKNVIKLAQGEFVATAKLETVFTASPLIRQIFIHARSEWSSLLAVVVPAAHILGQFAELEHELKRLIHESFREIARKEQLRPYEIPRDFIIEHEPFSQQNGLLSDHGKPMWPKLRARYAAELDKLHGDISSREIEKLRDIYRNRSGQTVIETVQQAVQSIFGSSDIDVKPTDYFRDLGGDSLSAVQLSIVLEEAFDTRVPIDMIISRGTDLKSLADYIEQKRQKGTDRLSVSSVHGVGATAYHASQLTLDKFIAPAVLERAAALPGSDAARQTVLLTGASGFLGRFLCLTLLTSLASTGGRLICLVRGKDRAAAYERLASAFEGHDPRLRHEFRRLSARHLDVIAGDIALPQLGLDNDTWERLSGEVDAIVHAGALVNHILPYSQLFDANVLGTTELIELALTGRLKEFVFISSIAVAAPSEGRNALDEEGDIRQSLASMTIDRAYASGYATSKWSGEVLLREAHEKFGLPVTVFRSSMILAHRDFEGQINLPDAFTRLLLSVILTSLAPRSFYRTDAAIPPSRAHYDGLPVDFTANAIVTLGLGYQYGYRTYSLVNPHDDGVSLDTVVGWLEESGHRVRRISDYKAWLEAFGNALRALPAHSQKHSVLPLLHGYERPLDPVSGSLVPSSEFERAVAKARLRLGKIPQLSKYLIVMYISELLKMGLIPETSSSTMLSPLAPSRSFDVV